MYVIVIDRGPMKREILETFITVLLPNVSRSAKDILANPIDKGAVYVIYGILRGGEKILKKCMDHRIDYIYIDNAYLPHLRKIYFSITANSMQNTTFIPEEMVRFQRAQLLSTELVPQQDGPRKGKYVMVCPPSVQIASLMNAQSWTASTVAQIRRLDPEVAVVVRPKDKSAFAELEDLRRSHGNVTLCKSNRFAEAAAKAICVCVYNSRVAVEAVIAGVPVYTSEQSIAHVLSQSPERITCPRPYDDETRRRFLEHVSQSQFTKNEIRKGTFLRFIGDTRTKNEQNSK